MLRRLAGRCLMGAGALMLALTAVATSSFAQGMFYKEETKDGRIYVFNDQGELGAVQGVGRDGHRAHPAGRGAERRDGLRGQRDGPRAVLLQARHRGGRWSGPKPPVQTRRVARRQDPLHRWATTSTWRCRTASSRASPTRCPTTRVQLPGTAGRGRQQGQLPHPPREVQARGLVLQARARVRAAAQLDGREQHARPASSSRTRTSTGTSRRRRPFRVKFGQFKAPFGRQQLTSSGAQQFVDRAIQDARYNDARETGSRALGHPRRQQARLARHGLERQRPHPGPERQRQVPLHRRA